MYEFSIVLKIHFSFKVCTCTVILYTILYQCQYYISGIKMTIIKVILIMPMSRLYPKDLEVLLKKRFTPKSKTQVSARSCSSIYPSPCMFFWCEFSGCLFFSNMVVDGTLHIVLASKSYIWTIWWQFVFPETMTWLFKVMCRPQGKLCDIVGLEH